MRKTPPASIDAYLARVPEPARSTLEKLRQAIKAAAPGAVEAISYQMPAFKLDGRGLVAFAAFDRHCSLFPMSSKLIAAKFADKLKGYVTSKGTIRFACDRPLPAALVKSIVKARIAENALKAPAKAPSRSKATAPSKGGAEVDTFMRTLKHPLKAEIESVRRIVLDVSPAIGEGIKWKAPSFRTTDDFATVNLRATDGVQLIFHTGAKVKASARTGVKVADPAGLATWLAKDRCLVTLGTASEIAAKRKAFESFVRAWIKQI